MIGELEMMVKEVVIFYLDETEEYLQSRDLNVNSIMFYWCCVIFILYDQNSFR
jgi:hypothetical protein